MENREHRRIGDYEVLRRIAVGGMGEVLQVRHTLTGRIEAMKVLLPNYVGNRQRQERFLREIQTVAKLEHPNIARLCTATTHEDQIVMVMDYVDGPTVESLIEDKPLPIGKAVRYMVQALQALAYAHARGIVHRDFKPANLMVTADGTVKLMDFGIALTEGARLTQNGSTVGTYYFMSPEQVRGENMDGRSDLYSAGVTLYEMLTGRTPFLGTTPTVLMEKHVNAVPPPPSDFREDLPPTLNAVILKLLAKNPADRYQTADEAREALEAAMPGRPLTQDESASGRRATVTETPAFKRAPTTVEDDRQEGHRPVRHAVTSDGAAYAQDPGIRAVKPHASAAGNTSRQRLPIGAAALVLVCLSGGLYAYVHHEHQPTKVPVVEPPHPSPAPVAPPAEGKTAIVTPNRPQRSTGQIAVAGKGNVPNIRNEPGVTVRETITVAHRQGTQVDPAPVAPTISPDLKASLDHIGMELDSVESRALATDEAINAKKSQMAALHMQMRSDVVGEQLSMNNSRIKARLALKANDADGASRYLAQEKSDLEKLETFLGR